MRIPGRRAFTACLLGAALSVALATSASAACSLSQLIQLPVTMTDGRPVVHARINGADSTLVVGTGYAFNLLSRGTIGGLGLRVFDVVPPGDHDVEGADDDRQAAIVRTFGLPDLTASNAPFLVERVSFRNGAVGALGQSTFAAGDVEFDFAGGAMRVYKAEGCESDAMAFWAPGKPYSVIDLKPISDDQPFILGSASINGQPVRVMFVSDLKRSLVTHDAAQKLGLASGPKDALGWAAAPIASFQIGDEAIHATRLLVSPHGGGYYGGDADLYLGADFFLAHHLYLSRKQSRLYFTYIGGKMFGLEAPSDPGDDYGGPGQSALHRATARETLRQVAPLDAVPMR